MNVFICWSGDFTRELASRIKEFIAASSPALNVELSSPENPHGEEWYNQAITKLKEADVLLLLIANEALDSWWLPFESGFVARASDEKGKKLIFPFLVDNFDESDLKRFGPLAQFNFQQLSRENLGEFLTHLQNIQASPSSPVTSDGKVARRPEAIWSEIDKLLKKGKGDADRVARCLEVVAERLGPTCGVSSQVVRDFSKIHKNGFDDTELFKLPSDVSALLKHISATQGELSPARKAAIIEQLSDIQDRMGRLRRGEVHISGPGKCKQFFVNMILQQAEKSIWTTNLPGTFGRQNDGALLTEQAEAVRRTSSNVTRVFILPSTRELGETEFEIHLRRSVESAIAQIDLGINVQWLSRERLDQTVSWFPDAGAALGSPDFMIIDDNRVYTTHLFQPVLSSIGPVEDHVRLTYDRGVLNAARKLKTAISPEAKSVKATDLIEIAEGNKVATKEFLELLALAVST